jgi:UDP-glucose 4-epimerase
MVMSDFTNLERKRILVTGGSGFIASHLVRRLVDLGSEVHVLTKYDSVIDNVRLAGLWEKVTPVEADLRNTDSLKQLTRIKPHIVFHFAAYNHVGDSFTHINEALTSNAVGTANLMEAWDGYDRFVYVSTSEVYGYQQEVPFREDMQPFPISPYAVGKYAGETYARMQRHVRNLPIVMLRPFNAFGPYQSPRAVIAEMILKCLRGQTIKATEGKQTREFNFVENHVDGFLAAALADTAVGEIINLGSNHEISIRDLILKIHHMTNSKSELQIGALEYRPTEIWRMCADWNKAKDLLGWTPRVSLDEGLAKTIGWYRKFVDVYTSGDSPLVQL